MESFFKKNPGLKSRVQFSLDFKDYSADELEKIISLEASKRGFVIAGKEVVGNDLNLISEDFKYTKTIEKEKSPIGF